ncbi:hypothetical protein VE00_00047 [Pseudogymnoascus sp. WSF 3629]|nr:hypothetical protein VE00_00047 [Pseudogymnoascus sp. WSF 3629]
MIEIAVGGIHCVRNWAKPHSRFLHLQHTLLFHLSQGDSETSLRMKRWGITLSCHPRHSLPTSPTFSPESPIRGIDDDPEDEIMENLSLVSSPMSVPNGADFCPPSPILSREDLEETTPIQSSDQTSQPNAIESQAVPPTLSSHTVISPVRQPLPTIATRDSNPDINRMEQILGAANRLRGAPFPGGYTEFNKYTLWGSQLAGSFNYEAIIQNVKGILSHVDPQRATMVSGKHIQNPTISLDIYRLLPKTKPGTARTTASVFSEAFRLWQLKRYLAAEIPRRHSLLPLRHGIRTNGVQEEIKVDFACANSGLSIQGLLVLREESRGDYDALMRPINRLYDGSNIIENYTEAMGTPAALLIWPWTKAQQVTRLALHQQDMVFLSAMIQFIQGAHGFLAVQELLKHMSIWFKAGRKERYHRIRLLVISIAF